MTAGTHTVKLLGEEDGIRLKALKFTSASACSFTQVVVFAMRVKGPTRVQGPTRVRVYEYIYI